MKTAYPILIALLAAPVGAQEQPLTQEQDDACGAMMCLAGGAATPECNPYLKKFFDTDPKDRKGFLNKCPTTGISQDAIGELAAHGQNCASKNLATYLNRQLCSAEQKKSGFPCRGADPNAWRTCASYYAELTDEQPPRLVQRCWDERDLTGAIEQVCSHRWVTSDYKTGSWCKDKNESCQETDLSSQADQGLAGVTHG